MCTRAHAREGQSSFRPPTETSHAHDREAGGKVLTRPPQRPDGNPGRARGARTALPAPAFRSRPRPGRSACGLRLGTGAGHGNRLAFSDN